MRHVRIDLQIYNDARRAGALRKASGVIKEYLGIADKDLKRGQSDKIAKYGRDQWLARIRFPNICLREHSQALWNFHWIAIAVACQGIAADRQVHPRGEYGRRVRHFLVLIAKLQQKRNRESAPGRIPGHKYRPRSLFAKTPVRLGEIIQRGWKDMLRRETVI